MSCQITLTQSSNAYPLAHIPDTSALIIAVAPLLQVTPTVSCTQHTRRHWYNIATNNVSNLRRVWTKYVYLYDISKDQRNLHSGPTFGILLALHDDLQGLNQNRFTASSKYGHWRKK